MFDLFQFDFIVRAFVVGGVLAVIAPLIGIFLVVRRYAALGDTLAHVSLVGVALSFFTRLQPIIVTLIVTVLSAVGIEILRYNKKVLSDSLLVVFLSGSLGIATILMSISNGLNAGVLSFLFGSISTVTAEEVWITLAVGIFVLLIFSLFFRKFFLIATDEEFALTKGLSVRSLNILFMILAALTISLTMRIVGILLVGSLMIIPPLAAMQWNKGFQKTLMLSILFSLFSVFFGLFASYYLNFPTGGAIVLASLIVFIMSSLNSLKSVKSLKKI